jgi:hypothetical protein
MEVWQNDFQNSIYFFFLVGLMDLQQSNLMKSKHKQLQTGQTKSSFSSQNTADFSVIADLHRLNVDPDDADPPNSNIILILERHY